MTSYNDVSNNKCLLDIFITLRQEILCPIENTHWDMYIRLQRYLWEEDNTTGVTFTQDTYGNIYRVKRYTNNKSLINIYPRSCDHQNLLSSPKEVLSKYHG